MKALTFRGGIHPPEAKESTEHLKIEKAVDPETVIIPMQQHIGAPCEPTVKVGDTVKVGQKVGEAQGFVSSPVHASVSGTVKAIMDMPIVTGNEALAVIIESDGKNEIDPSVEPKGDIAGLQPKEIINIIKEAGIVGMGGATFPTHVKLSPPPDKKVDTIILNGAECEPYLTADHRIMLETPDDIVYGLKAMMKAVGVKKGYIGIENNKPDAIEVMLKAISNESDIKVVALQTKYPQGGEKQLIYAVTNKEVPSGGLPMDVGVIVSNVGTAAQIAKSIKTGMPLIERVTTVTGKAIKKPRNLMVKIGTPIKELIDQCGGYATTPGKLILGGPMMGIAQHTDEVSAVKGTSGVLVFDKEGANLPNPINCIRCGRCVEICPANLQPVYISENSLSNRMEQAEKYRALDCIECGSCSYVCPSRRPLLPSIRVAKNQIIAKKREQKKKSS
ncbi:electron transport complex RnfABCDGE type C subunit [Clostridium aceticum]|uniref:Ion-translocating oxidoreductase complex subunit C n=1 Tax=Clostridium aceticum TaxID=84022 RepID=A0A0D8ICD4_9CLOT|nr:electron transport complex subunit RsxC [Clostridium aceticum]AKL95081.1 electron transport complex RnfABCDGE type C subunit [Clostridium aceticum]KJF27965.1 electron transporter RnfC [Clostridium aceticum]